jgi:hypothetical protein
VVTLSTTLPTRIAVLAMVSTPDCSASGNSLQCHLDSVLHFLYATGIALAAVLVVISIVAIRIYYRNRNTRILKRNSRSRQA